ncbi:Beta-xylosidase [Fibrobacter sp. UWH9]|uniref:beta-xylosidase family glycoside hydrolase n=1 Tax=Fibrobacter sp. UWH9 TaxID=1896213 RepID=UPI000910D9A7|nr:family 43 glycosylhydrolase [Fibrobacter sp. UWH9]SHG61869.1 Beta-xylosidase [Fibrobacter sp. UWH9]
MGLLKKFFAGAALLGSAVGAFAVTVNNPVIWSDSPDPSIVRVEGNYYMVTTTMHYAPGIPIFKSTDLAQWRTIGYVYETLTNNDNMNLNGGKDAYGKGSWASSIRYREKDGYYYVLTPSYTTNKTHLYKTKDIEGGPWSEVQLPFYHDPSLFFDDDGTAWVFYGSGDQISYVQLNDDASGVKAGGRSGKVGGVSVNKITGKGDRDYYVQQEGSHMEKVNGEYYLFTISWPAGACRTEIVYRSKNLLDGFTGRIFLQDNGVAQGGIFDTPDGKWYALLFRDSGPIGRISHLVPTVWKDGWPEPEGGSKKAPATLDLPSEVEPGYGMVTSDDFDGDELPLEWQWNHNPDNSKWKLADGKLRITTGRTDARITSVKNMLTQRTFGPKCVGRTLVDGTNMNDGDVAGLAAWQDNKGMVAITKESGSYKVVMYSGTKDGEKREASENLSGSKVYLRVDFDIPVDKGTASFYYSEDGSSWKKIGTNVSLSFDLHMFVGNRFGLFNWATKTAGGSVDFDWFKIGVDANDEIYLDGAGAEPIPQTAHNATQTPWALPGQIEAEDFDDPGKGKGGPSYSDKDSENRACTGDKVSECSDYRKDTGVDLYKKSGDRIVVGYIQKDEWLEYTINVTKAGDYTLFAAVASDGGSSFKLSLDGKDLTEDIAVPAAKKDGDSEEQNFDDYNKVNANVVLPAGEHILRFTATADWFDIDYFNFAEGKDATDPAPIGTTSIRDIRMVVGGQQNYRVFNLNGNLLGIVNSNGADIVNVTRDFVKQSGMYIVKPVRGGLVHKITVTK